MAPQLTRLSSCGSCAETGLPLPARPVRKRCAPDRDGSVTPWRRCPRRARGCPRKSLRPSRDQRVRLLLPGSDGAGHRRIASTPWGEGKQTRKHVLEQDDGIGPYFARSSVAGSSGIGWRLLTMHLTQSSPGADPSFSSSLACSFEVDPLSGGSGSLYFLGTSSSVLRTSESRTLKIILFRNTFFIYKSPNV